MNFLYHNDFYNYSHFGEDLKLFNHFFSHEHFPLESLNEKWDLLRLVTLGIIQKGILNGQGNTPMANGVILVEWLLVSD